MHNNTIRVLSLDGGGVRGYMSLKFLQRFITDWGIAGNELWKYFDVIAGASIGGIQALSYAYGKSPDEVESFFLEKAKRIFTIRSIPIGCDTSNNSNRPSLVQKLAFVILNDPFYASPCAPNAGNSNYGSNILQSTLVENFGDYTLQALKTKVLVPAYEKDRSRYVVFSNYVDSMFIGPDAKIVDVARATSAAPVYLPKYSFNSHVYADGGLFQNNPTEFALSLARMLKPMATRTCVLSLGTGIGEMGFDGASVPDETDSAIADMFSLFNVAATGGQESISYNLRLRSRRTLERLYYYRFQPMLDPAINTELDNSDASFLTYLTNTANNYYTNTQADITNFLGHLTL